ncbi:MAG: APC family permease [Actinomycetota bacterium]
MANSDAPLAPTGVLKRVVLGRAFSSSGLEHTLLPKVLALPVFASDALSSVAYATGEILIALTLVTMRPQPFVMPIAIAIGSLMIIVVASYRQTVRAYPSGGGAYIVSRENLGTVPALIAASALLFDYMMTVVVSIVAGVFAIGSAIPWANEHKVLLSIGFVIFVTFTNLRGSRESGTLFAIPTYGFVLSIGILLVIGLGRCVTGCPEVGLESEPLHDAATTAGAIGLFALLRAFSLGATALTGVEAISNGVPAFRRPQAHNAATTLAIMGGIAVSMFLGISWLATHVEGVVASEERSVVAQIAIAVFGNSSIGFFVVQFFTATILILAANTAYQDFPRLASILARDRFMPHQFVNRGDRLVFSNGVIVLGALSCLMIWLFDASLSVLINFYVVGVFTSFTLSQSGMVRHWIVEGRKGAAAMAGWRRSIVINVVGALTTGVVLVVVIVSKFEQGAWLSILIMAVLVPGFYSIHHHYTNVRSQLRAGRVRSGATGQNHLVLLVRDFDVATAEAVGYLRSFRPEEIRPVFPCRHGVTRDVQARWRTFVGLGIPDLMPISPTNLTAGIRHVVESIDRGPDDFVTVAVPELLRPQGLFSYLVRNRDLVRLKASMLRTPNVVVTDVPVVLEEGTPSAAGGKPLIPQRTVTLVLLSSVNDVSVRAVNYARTLDATVTRAVYFDLDPEAAVSIGDSWFDVVEGVPLDIVEAPFRDLSTPMLEEVRRYTERPGTIVNVVIPEYIVAKWWQLPLHGQTALFVKRLFLFEERVLLTSVAYQIESGRATRTVPAVEADSAD